MATFYLTLLVIGGGALAVQLVLGFFGADSELADLDGTDGLDLFTVRALSAAAAGFGATGLGLMQWGLPGALVFPIALLVGLGAATAVAYLVRGVRRLDVDKSFDIGRTIGTPARVYLTIPGERGGMGKVHLSAGARFMELNALTAESTIPAGDEVFVVDTVSFDTVLVSRRSLIPEDSR